MRKINEIKKQVRHDLQLIINAVYQHKLIIEPPVDRQIFVTGLQAIVNDNEKVTEIAHIIQFDDKLFGNQKGSCDSLISSLED